MQKDTLVDAQYEAFISFLKMESVLAGENPITIKINYFSPKELECFFSKLNKLESKLSNIVLELLSSPEQCVYGDNQKYDLQ